MLVTGAAGKIGTACTALLLRSGLEVVALSPSYPPGFGATRSIVGDATSENDVRQALDGVDAVVHLAAIPHPDHAPAYDVYRTNVNSTFNVLSQAGERGITRAIIASSINAFGVPMNPHAHAPAYMPIDEDIPADIADPYSLSKFSDELTAVMAWRRWGIDVVAFRFPIVDSVEQLSRYRDALARSPRAAAKEGWAYLRLEDAARAVLTAVNSTLTGAHVINLSASDTLVDRPTAELLADYLPGVPVRRPIEGVGALIDTSRARELLGFVPQFSIHSRRGAPSVAHS